MYSSTSSLSQLAYNYGNTSIYPNGGWWPTWKNPFINDSDSVSYFAEEQSIYASYIPSQTAPTFTTPSYNATRAGGTTQFQITASYPAGLSGYIFYNGASNSTYTPVSGAPISLLINSTMTMPSSGSVSVEWYANGTDGSWNSSGLYTYPVFQMASVLAANGNKLYLSNGTSIILRGVDYTYFVDDPDGSWMLPDGSIEWLTWDTTGVADFVNLCQAWNVNVVRTLLTVQFWEDNYTLYESHLAYFANALQQKGIFVDFCFYKNNASESQQYVLPWNDTGNGYINTEQDLINLWMNFSLTFSNVPNVLFELWNEPQNGTVYSGGQWVTLGESDWMSFTQQCINIFRANGTSNPVVVQWGGNLGVDYASGAGFPNVSCTEGMDMSFVTAYPLTDPAGNIIYSDHIYRNGFRNSSASYAEPYLEYAVSSGESPTYFDMYTGLSIDKVFSVAQNHPVWIGEIGDRLFGMPDNTTYEDAWFNNTLTLLDQYGIGYAGWAAPPWRSGAGEYFGYVIGGDANYTLDSSGTILVNHLVGVTYSTWLNGGVSPSVSMSILATDATGAQINRKMQK
jgi:hypothetical protein